MINKEKNNKIDNVRIRTMLANLDTGSRDVNQSMRDAHVYPAGHYISNFSIDAQNSKNAILNDPSKSAVGIEEALGEFREQKLAELAVKEKSLPFDEMASNIKAHMSFKDDSKDDVITELRSREMRDNIRSKMKPLEVENYYLKCCQNDDNALFVQAVETAMPPFNIVKQDIIDRGRQLRLERQHPEKAEQLKQIAATKAVITGLFDAVRASL